MCFEKFFCCSGRYWMMSVIEGNSYFRGYSIALNRKKSCFRGEKYCKEVVVFCRNKS